MKNRLVLGFVLFLLAVMASACNGGKVDYGMNAITLKQLEKKLEEHETFVFMTFAATDEHVKKTKLIEAYDDGLRRAGLKGFYVNLEKEDAKTISDLGERHTHPSMYRAWEPDDDGLMRSESGGVVGPRRSLSREAIVKRANEEEGFSSEFTGDYGVREIDEQVTNMLEKIQENNLELTYK